MVVFEPYSEPIFQNQGLLYCTWSRCPQRRVSSRAKQYSPSLTPTLVTYSSPTRHKQRQLIFLTRYCFKHSPKENVIGNDSFALHLTSPPSLHQISSPHLSFSPLHHTSTPHLSTTHPASKPCCPSCINLYLSRCLQNAFVFSDSTNFAQQMGR